MRGGFTRVIDQVLTTLWSDSEEEAGGKKLKVKVRFLQTHQSCKKTNLAGPAFERSETRKKGDLSQSGPMK